MIKICAPKNVSEIYIKKQLWVQTTQNLYRKSVGFFEGPKVNGSVALTQFLFVARSWQQGPLSLIAGSDTKGVTL
jgi:hypothetical protein